MTPDDLFVDPPFVGGWPSEPPELRTESLESLRRGAVDGVDDMDIAQALGELLRSDFVAYGTAGGARLSDPEVRIALRAWRATLSRLGVSVDIGWQDFPSFRSYWVANGGHGSWGVRRHMVGEAFEPVMARIYSLQERASVGTVVEPALSALNDPAVIKEHLRRMEASLDADPRLAVSVAKDLVESTAKLVLMHRAVTFARTDDLPALVARAQEALQLHAAGVPSTSEDSRALKTILGSLANLIKGVTELRNEVGVGHGRESAPTWVRPRHARLAAGAATTWCNVMLETLGDPEAPWRQTAASTASDQ